MHNVKWHISRNLMVVKDFFRVKLLSFICYGKTKVVGWKNLSGVGGKTHDFGAMKIPAPTRMKFPYQTKLSKKNLVWKFHRGWNFHSSKIVGMEIPAHPFEISIPTKFTGNFIALLWKNIDCVYYGKKQGGGWKKLRSFILDFFCFG